MPQSLISMILWYSSTQHSTPALASGHFNKALLTTAILLSSWQKTPQLCATYLFYWLLLPSAAL